MWGETRNSRRQKTAREAANESARLAENELTQQSRKWPLVQRAPGNKAGEHSGCVLFHLKYCAASSREAVWGEFGTCCRGSYRFCNHVVRFAEGGDC